MSNLVFIDGAAGTTGLQVADRLASRADLELLILDETARKQEAARRDAMQAADIAILCLPDEAARAAAQMAEGLSVRLIDASSAHRTAAGWVYGFAELEADRAAEITAARLVSNPGCYPSGFLALARPLIRAGWLAPSASLNVPAVSGYSGGGKALIEKFESGKSATGLCLCDRLATQAFAGNDPALWPGYAADIHALCRGFCPRDAGSPAAA